MKTESIDGYTFSREGFLLTGLDEHEISYLQYHADLIGPDSKMNNQLRKKVTNKDNWQHSISNTNAYSISIKQIQDFKLDERCLDVFKKIPVPAIEISKLIWKFYWLNKTYKLKDDSRVLCIGANPGLECLVAQTLFPKWQITGVDFKISEKTFFKNLIELNIADLDKAFSKNSFDVCFSNHVLEHLGPPRDKVLKGVKSILDKDGFFTSALPCDSNPKYVPIDDFFNLLKKNESKYMHLINPAHMWKCDIFNIHDVLTQNGFNNIEFFRYEGSGKDNNEKVFNQVPHDLLTHESIAENKPLAKKAWDMLKYILNVRNPKEISLKWYYHKIRKDFAYHHQVPEILFCCRPASL